MIIDCRDHFEAVPLVERRGLERKGHQHDLRAAAPTRLLLGGLEQPRPESAVRRDSSTQNWRSSQVPPHVFPQIPATMRSPSRSKNASISPSAMPVALELNS